jgi:phosphoserine phosphatase RsbX
MDTGLVGLIEWSVAGETKPGEVRSGDHYLVEDSNGGMLLAAVDSLGHGEGAAEIAERAVNCLRGHMNGSLVSMLHACQEQLKGTRGAVLSLALLNASDSTLTWLGVGNVTGVLMRGDASATPRQEFLLLRSGVVGDRLPPLASSTVPINCGDVLIFATDGIRNGFLEDTNTSVSTEEIARQIIERHWRKIDDALVLVARYVYKSNVARHN